MTLDTTLSDVHNHGRDNATHVTRVLAEAQAYFQQRADSILIDELLTEHGGHYPSFVRECRLCIYRATKNMHIGGKNAGFARAFMSNIDTETRHSIVLAISRLLCGSEMDRL